MGSSPTSGIFMRNYATGVRMNAVIPGRFLPLHRGHTDFMGRAVSFARSNSPGALVTLLVVGSPADSPSLETRVQWLDALVRDWGLRGTVDISSLQVPVTLSEPRKDAQDKTLQALTSFIRERNFTHLFLGTAPNVAGVPIAELVPRLPKMVVRRFNSDFQIRSADLRADWVVASSSIFTPSVLNDVSNEWNIHSFDSLRPMMTRQLNRWGTDRVFSNVMTFALPETFFGITVDKTGSTLEKDFNKFITDARLRRDGEDATHRTVANLINYAPIELLMACNPLAPEWVQEGLSVFPKHPHRFHILVFPTQTTPETDREARNAFYKVLATVKASGQGYEVLTADTVEALRQMMYSLIRWEGSNKFASALPQV